MSSVGDQIFLCPDFQAGGEGNPTSYLQNIASCFRKSFFREEKEGKEGGREPGGRGGREEGKKALPLDSAKSEMLIFRSP